MTTSNFATMAREVFKFLEQRSFVYSWDGGYRVRFDSPTVFVIVVYDATRSYELGLEIGLQVGISHPVERPFTISDILRVAGRLDLGKATALIQVRADEVCNRLEWLAGFLREHCSRFLDGERTLFESLDNQRDTDCRVYAKRTELAKAMREAGNAWQQSKFDEVVKQLEPLEEYLPASEQMRLEIARKRSKTN